MEIDMDITREKIISIIVRFFTMKKNLTYYSLNNKTGVDQKSIKAWEMQMHKRVRTSSFESFVLALQDDISSSFEEFAEFFIKELENDGIIRENIQEIFNNTKNMLSITEQLLQLDIATPKFMQDKIGTANIIRTLKILFSPYRDYFQISESGIGETELSHIYEPLVYTTGSSEDPTSSVSELNYLVVKFPNAYHVGIILSNHTIDYCDKKAKDYYSYMIEKLELRNNLKMLLFITDVDKKSIPIYVQLSLMKDYNLFFEFVNPKDLQKISIQGLILSEMKFQNLQKTVEQHRYAQLIFERFMSYLSVISNEIIFGPYLDKLDKELDLEKSSNAERTLEKILVSYQKRTNVKNFTNYANETLIKEICQYSYLSRHTIYHERTLIANEVATMLKKQGIGKIPLVVEICAPNSLTTCSILDKCEKLLLFTASHNAYSVMKKLEEKTEKHFLPPNVSLLLSHLNPEYMMHQYPNELNGKVDLLVIGYGGGSQINDLIRFIRYAYNWLSENGVLFISVYNKEAIVLNKYHIHDQRFENSPLYISDYWTYTRNGQTPLLKTLKSYSLDNFHATYLSLFDAGDIQMSTYPYISALINPSEYSRTVLDEIREADKLFSSKGTRGQLIDVIAHKNKEHVAKKTATMIVNFLSKLEITYDRYEHTLAPDSKGLKQSLQAKNIPISNSTILKTVIFKKKELKATYENYRYWIYVILPYDKKVIYDAAKYELVPESLVIKKFNQGTISPLTIIAEMTEIPESIGPIFLLYNDCISKEYVIMGNGSNFQSIRIKTKSFQKIVDNMHIVIKDKIE